MINHSFYDQGMAELFRHPPFIRSLLTEIVAEPWVALLDLDAMQIEDGVHKEIEGPARFSDMVVSFPFKTVGRKPDGLSIYLLIEFQSSYEPMALRLLEYLARIYKKQNPEKSTAPLHPVVPIVIYNGESSWKEDDQFIHRFPGLPDTLIPYIPDFRYFLLDEGRFDRKMLKKLKGAVASFIRLDTIDRLEHHDLMARQIIAILKELRDSDPESAMLLGKYMEGLLAHWGIANEEAVGYINEGRKSMLGQRFERYVEEKVHEGLQRGMEQGLEQGIEQGIEKGTEAGLKKGALLDKQAVLLRMMDKKFSLAAGDEELVRSCTNLEKLDEALDIILFTERKEAVLEKLG
jgi:predicted transposase/invertase (TIGR01784 family)